MSVLHGVVIGMEAIYLLHYVLLCTTRTFVGVCASAVLDRSLLIVTNDR